MKSLILIGIDTTDARRMLGKAGNKDQSMEKALKKAVKETAKQARERLAKQAQKSYTVKMLDLIKYENTNCFGEPPGRNYPFRWRTITLKGI